jgi:acetyl-CoA decarbonylase/synthase complex subunit gamma
MTRASPLDVYALVDKSNCKECGYDTCMAFATDLLERKIRLKDCTHLMKDPKQQKNLKKLIELTMPPQRPVEIGIGERAITIGGEEVLMRHQLTYYNQTAIFIEVPDNIADGDLKETIQYLTKFKIERMGEGLKINGIALRCASGDKDKFKSVAKQVAESSDLPIMLCCLNSDILLAAASEIKDKKPLLYAAIKDTWEKVGAFAIQNNLPVVASAVNLDDLISLSATLQKFGLKQIILDAGTFYGPGNLAASYDNIMKLRTAAIDKGDSNAGWPIMGVPAAYWTKAEIKSNDDLWKHQFQEVIMASIMISIDTSLLVLHTGQKKEDIWALLALLTMRQTVFSDPRVYPAVDPGLFKIGEPGPMAPIFVTSNYRMTKIPVELDIKGGNVDSWLLVINSEGIGIESSVAGGQFNSSAIAEAVSEFKAFEKVNHRILIIPGMAARLSGALEDEADCYVVVGPRDSSAIPSFIEKQWDPEKFMKDYKERKE